jgi:hypothetical protein
MQSLQQQLGSTHCAFIRCVKPNARMSPGRFEQGFVSRQLRVQGVLEACSVLKAGLPHKVPVALLLRNYRVLPASLQPIYGAGGKKGGDERYFCQALLWAFEVPPEQYRIGLSQVFLQPRALAMVRAIMGAGIDRAIEARLRTYYSRRLWRVAVQMVTGAKKWSRLPAAKGGLTTSAPAPVVASEVLSPISERERAVQVHPARRGRTLCGQTSVGEHHAAAFPRRQEQEAALAAQLRQMVRPPPLGRAGPGRLARAAPKWPRRGRVSSRRRWGRCGRLRVRPRVGGSPRRRPAAAAATPRLSPPSGPSRWSITSRDRLGATGGGESRPAGWPMSPVLVFGFYFFRWQPPVV